MCFLQDIDESFINKPSSLAKIKTSPANSQSQKKNNSTKTSRSVGLNKKITPAKPAQKSLLSMFMLQPK